MFSLKTSLSATSRLTMALLAVTTLAPPAFADDDESPGLAALERFRDPTEDRPVLSNRFFVKTERFEVSPYFGYVPNNPFAVRYGGGVMVGYHFNEQLAAQGTLYYAPDLGEGDLKGLTKALVQIAHTGPSGAGFQQPLDKITLGAAFAASWAPVYGKINLLGETVISFDLYGTAGIGMLSKIDYFAVFDEASANPADPVLLNKIGNEVKFTPTIGVGTNFYLTQSVALKLDARFNFYIDNEPQYDAAVPATGQRLYNVFVASVGVSVFFPKMKRRVFDF